MKKPILSTAFIITTTISINAFGACTEYNYTPSGYTDTGTTIDTTNDLCNTSAGLATTSLCNEQTRRCLQILKCNVCNGPMDFTSTYYVNNSTCPNTNITAPRCCVRSPGSTETSNWTRVSFNVMYQYQETKTYECDGSYTSSFAYRCASGAYGTARGSSYSIGNLSGCSRCPSGGTSSAGSTSITSCYIPSGTAFNETSGTGTYTQNCYYKN